MGLGNNILKLRKKLQLSQEKLGELVGVTRQTISNWELNETVPDAKQLISLSKILQVSIDALVDNDIWPLLEQKVNNVETNVIKSTKLLRIIFILSLIIICMVIFFILAS